MRLVKDSADFEGILSRFLDWRRERDTQRTPPRDIEQSAEIPAMAGE
jgi:hypothetical protein